MTPCTEIELEFHARVPFHRPSPQSCPLNLWCSRDSLSYQTQGKWEGCTLYSISHHARTSHQTDAVLCWLRPAPNARLSSSWPPGQLTTKLIGLWVRRGGAHVYAQRAGGSCGVGLDAHHRRLRPHTPCVSAGRVLWRHPGAGGGHADAAHRAPRRAGQPRHVVPPLAVARARPAPHAAAGRGETTRYNPGRQQCTLPTVGSQCQSCTRAVKA